MASPAKQQRLETFVTEFVEEIDTELKAVCYDVTSMNGGQAIKSHEKIRRKLKAMEGKVKTLVKVNENENAKLIKENFELKKEIGNLKKKINLFEEDDTFPSYDEPSKDSCPITGPSDTPQTKSPTE